jgi:hypothetical protein
MNVPRLLSGALPMLASAAGCAFDFKTVGAAPAILDDAPPVKGGIAAGIETAAAWGI